MLKVASDLLKRKNSLYGGGVWAYCIDITLPDGTEIAITSDGLPVTWNSRNYIPFNFQLDVLGGERRGEHPQSVVKVGNATRALVPYLEKGDGGVGSEVAIHVVNTKATQLPSAGSYQFVCTKTSVNSKWVTFTLGTPTLARTRFPRNNIRRNQCPWRFRGTECTYTGTMIGCDKTLSSCKERVISPRFGGFPGAGRGGLDI